MVGTDGGGSVIAAGQHEGVVFEQVEHGNAALLLDLGRGGRKIGVIEDNICDARHGVLRSGCVP